MYSNPTQWRRIRKRILVSGQSIRSVAKREGMSRPTIRKMLHHELPPGYGNKGLRSPAPKRLPPDLETNATQVVRQRWMEWLYEIERCSKTDDALECALSGLGVHDRKRILCVMAHLRGFSISAIVEHLILSRNTIRRCLARFEAGGLQGLLARKERARKADDECFRKALSGLLHEPPSLSGFNRTTWRMADLQKTLAARGFVASDSVIREAIHKAGFRWRSAKVVLTSTDPHYREKLDHVRSVLSNLDSDELFFSIDEYGPFAVKAKPGRLLAGPGQNPSVPQWQKSKGWLIVTAALELSHNQVTHFYSPAKNTAEMIKMAERLLAEYSHAKTLYLSWDAASWHVSKALLAFIGNHNAKAGDTPHLDLVPLPASAPFLNVIESVFSGMARAIIHNSDYPSLSEARTAIDLYFAERNRYYVENPRRAGQKIWGKERIKPEFDQTNNCKDPAYQ